MLRKTAIISKRYREERTKLLLISFHTHTWEKLARTIFLDSIGDQCWETETVYLSSSVRGRTVSGTCASYARSRGLQLLLQKNVGDVRVWQLEAGPGGRASRLESAYSCSG